MKALKYTLYTIVAVLAVVIGMAWYMGYFKPVTIIQKDAGTYVLVGREFTGTYSDAGKHILQVVNELKDKGISGKKSFGMYYDAPGTKSKDSYRSFVGNILEEKDYGQLTELRSMGFRTDSVAFSKALVAEFPLKNSLSYMVGPMKVYPAISSHENSGNCKSSYSMEVYDVPAGKIVFIMPCN